MHTNVLRSARGGGSGNFQCPKLTPSYRRTRKVGESNIKPGTKRRYLLYEAGSASHHGRGKLDDAPGRGVRAQAIPKQKKYVADPNGRHDPNVLNMQDYGSRDAGRTIGYVTHALYAINHLMIVR